LSAFIGNLMLPPLSLLLLAALGLYLSISGRKTVGRVIVGAAWIALWLLSTPLVSNFLLQSLMPTPRVLNGSEADAIVILAGGSVPQAYEYGGSANLKWITLERVRYGAWLAKKFHKPILVTGGDPDKNGTSEARLMATTLELEFGVTPRWLEEASRTTLENAQDSVPLLKHDGIHRIYLVSHAWHLARATPEFERLGMFVVPAGIGYSVSKFGLYSLFPSASGLHNSYFACHEALGLIWYWLRSKFIWG
jgi:uncharacterized SAM-binding protein YcdF (DUF218 family)